MATADKASLRRDVTARVRALPPLRRALEEELVTGVVQASAEWASAATVAMYRGVGHELSPAGITNAAWRTGKTSVFPRVVGDALHWHVVRAWTELAPGTGKIPEPAAAAPRLEPDQIDLWLVPGVAFDSAGGRLGRGRGHYDRTLVHRRDDAPAWGLAFHAQVLDRLPREAHDVEVDRVVTAPL